MKTTKIRIPTIRYKNTKLPYRTNTPELAADLFRSLAPDNSREHFCALHLNSNNEIISFQIVSSGTINSALVHPREVFQAAIMCGATSIIIAHNHPSQTLDPSKEDRSTTDRLVAAGNLLGIDVLDSLIITDTAFNSIK